MAFFTSLGINPLSLGFYLLLFLVVFLILRRFAFGPILKTIEARQEKINQSLDEAQAAAETVRTSQERAEKVVFDASQEAQEIIRRAERVAADVHEKARAEAKTQADLFIVRARQEIDQERATAVAEIRAQVVDLALVAAGRVIEANLDADKNRQLVEETIKQAELRA